MSGTGARIRLHAGNFRSWYVRNSHYVNGLIGLTSVLGFLLGHFAPELLNQFGRAVVLIVTHDATHTFLLVAVLIILIMPSPEPQHQTDGGEPVEGKLAWAALFGLAVGMIASTYGNEWVVPSILGGMAVALYLLD